MELIEIYDGEIRIQPLATNILSTVRGEINHFGLFMLLLDKKIVIIWIRMIPSPSLILTLFLQRMATSGRQLLLLLLLEAFEAVCCLLAINCMVVQ